MQNLLNNFLFSREKDLFDREFGNLPSKEHKFAESEYIHKRIDEIVGSKVFTEESQITSIDILCYAMLKAELNNVPESKEVQAMKRDYPTLEDFLVEMDK